MRPVRKVSVEQGSIYLPSETPGADKVKHPSWDVVVTVAERNGMVTTTRKMVVRQFIAPTEHPDANVREQRRQMACQFATSLHDIIGADVLQTDRKGNQ